MYLYKIFYLIQLLFWINIGSKTTLHQVHECRRLVNAQYCCYPKQYVCVTCSERCPRCLKMRTRQLDQIVTANDPHAVPPTKARKSRCCNCSQQELPWRYQFFYEQKCKVYYCHPCILVFYQKYCLMINKFEKQFGSRPEMQVEIRCGCELQPKRIVEYAKNYCFDCSMAIVGKFMILRNQCRIMLRCVDNIKNAVQQQFKKPYHQKTKSLWVQIKKLMISCDSCKDCFDDRVPIAEQIGEFYICNRCLKMSKKYEQPYSKKEEVIDNKKSQKYFEEVGDLSKKIKNVVCSCKNQTTNPLKQRSNRTSKIFQASCKI